MIEAIGMSLNAREEERERKRERGIKWNVFSLFAVDYTYFRYLDSIRVGVYRSKMRCNKIPTYTEREGVIIN